MHSICHSNKVTLSNQLSKAIAAQLLEKEHRNIQKQSMIKGIKQNGSLKKLTSMDLMNGNGAFSACTLATRRFQFTYLSSIKCHTT